MAQKITTDIFQSKKLAEILPLESADMRYGYIAPYDYSDRMYDGGYDEIPYPKDFFIKNPNFSANEYDAELHCWSLASLLGVLPQSITKYIEGENCQRTFHLNLFRSYYHCVSYSFTPSVNDDNTLYCIGRDNWVDACVAMVEKLYELNLL